MSFLPQLKKPSLLPQTQNPNKNLITAEQGQELLELLKQSNWSPRSFLEILKAKGYNKVTELSVEDFLEFKHHLIDEV